MAAKGLRKILGAWVAPAVTLAVILAVAWFMIWYWLSNPTGITRLDPQIAAELQGTGHAVANVVPGMRLAEDQYITSLGPRGPWNIRSGIYRMTIARDRAGSFTYSFAVPMRDAYTGDDLKLVRLVQQLCYNPFARMRSGADPQLIATLSAKYARQLAPNLVVSDDDQQTLAQLWVQYSLNAGANGRAATGTTLIQTLAVAGQNSEANSRAAWGARLQEIRELIPAEMEERLLAAINGQPATRPVASQPTQ